MDWVMLIKSAFQALNYLNTRYLTGPIHTGLCYLFTKILF